jgi:DNA-binding NarL/FixJ family response regulator
VNRIRVLLAEDHETIRQALKLLIDAQPELEVVGEAADGAAAVAAAERLHPDVAVLDISMPKMNGLAAAREIAARAPSTAVVALTRYADEAYVKALLRAGVRGYVLKQSASSELIGAVRAAARGKQHLDANLARRAAMPERLGEAPARRLTDRETEVLRGIARGFSNKEMATELDLSVKTIEVHKANGMRKLGLTGRTDLVRYAMLQGWLSEV